jgi:hypothetical protein
LKILFGTYWSPGGWRDPPATAAADFRYAKRAGVMFDAVRLSHADVVRRARAAVAAVSRRQVADAFVASLASRRLELRSALGSFAVLQHFPRHPAPKAGGECPDCGVYSRSVYPEDLNVLNFERFKWGGVRHDEPLYASLDLELFQREPPSKPTSADVDMLAKLLQAIAAAPARTTAGSLQQRLAKSFPSNKPEREIVVNILGLCGILATPAHPGYLRRFVPCSARDLPPRDTDLEYPVCWWRRSHGINQEAVKYWFGHLLKGR